MACSPPRRGQETEPAAAAAVFQFAVVAHGAGPGCIAPGSQRAPAQPAQAGGRTFAGARGPVGDLRGPQLVYMLIADDIAVRAERRAPHGGRPRRHFPADWRKGLGNKEIAFSTGRDESVVSREIARHGARVAYRAWKADAAARESRSHPKEYK
jgi:hypothetical protein